jgi:hypothetical protein
MTVITTPSQTDISLNGYKVGDQVKWADPDNQCKWGTCHGVIMKGTEDYNLGQFVVFWYNGCTRHFGHKSTESDPITLTHVKIAFAI